MAIAAVPAYLGRDFSTASPGLRFGLYLCLWDEGFGLGAPADKASALKQSCRLTDNDLRVMRALHDRQAALAGTFIDAGALLAVHARAVAPFSTGLGNEHPLENGFAFLNPYGLPYLPGSGVKGVLRQAARELESGAWGDRHGWTRDAIDALFGKAPPEGSDDGHQRGALTCWDVLPQLAADAPLQVEVMTPHQTHYYQNGQNPHDSGSPNPISFLTVPPGSGFTFHLQCNEPFLRQLAPDLAHDRRWQALLQAALAHAFAWLGFGAKTSVGYGAMEVDAERERKAAQLRRERAQAEAEQRRQEEREAAKTQMSPADRAMADLYDQRIDKNQDERAVLFSALKAGKLGEHRVAAAERLHALMKQQGRWREKSEKKNPDKDQPYQDSLQVKKWLTP